MPKRPEQPFTVRFGIPLFESIKQFQHDFLEQTGQPMPFNTAVETLCKFGLDSKRVTDLTKALRK